MTSQKILIESKRGKMSKSDAYLQVALHFFM